MSDEQLKTLAEAIRHLDKYDSLDPVTRGEVNEMIEENSEDSSTTPGDFDE